MDAKTVKFVDKGVEHTGASAERKGIAAKKSLYIMQSIPKLLEESEIWQGGALNLSQRSDAEAAKLKKFSDAGGSQIQWLSDASPGVPNYRLDNWGRGGARNRLFRLFRYIILERG